MSHEEKVEPIVIDNKTGDVVHLEGGLDSATTVKEAIAAENADINMGVWEAVRTHKAAVFWSLMVSMCVVSHRCVSNTAADRLQVMESYDLCLLGNLLAMPCT